MILVDASPGERRIAVVGPAGLTEFRIWRPGAPDGVGAMHIGRVTAIVPAMAGSFLALADGEAFLPDTERPGTLGVGDLVTVRVARAAQGGKGRRVSGLVVQMAPAGEVRQVSPGPTPLDELAEAYPDLPIGVADLALRAELASRHPGRLVAASPAFDEALAADIEALSAREVALPGGMRASIVPTPALTAIDVDMGSATSRREAKARAQITANRAAIPEIARQIRLRDLAGAIVVDFAGLPAKRRSGLGPALISALAEDRRRPRLLGFSALGFAEILRPRVHPPLHEMLSGPHAAALAALREAVIAYPPDARMVLRGAPRVISAIEGDARALRELARHTSGCRMQPVPEWTGWRWSVAPDHAG